jgi:hypothetical protein
MMKTLAQVQFQLPLTFPDGSPLDTKGQVSLSLLMGKRIADICCRISNEFGDPVVQISKIVFEDGTWVHAEGEHDIAYIPQNTKEEGLSHEQLLALDEETS